MPDNFREGTPPFDLSISRRDTPVHLPIRVCHMDIIYLNYLNYKREFSTFVFSKTDASIRQFPPDLVPGLTLHPERKES